MTIDGEPVYASTAYESFETLMTYATKDTPEIKEFYSKDDKNGYFYGVNLELESTIHYNFYFKPGLEGKDFVVEYTFTHYNEETHIYTSDENATGVTGNIDLVYDENGYLIVSVDDLAPADARLPLTVKLYVDGNLETTVVTSIEDHCATALGLGDDVISPAEKEVYRAIMKFSDSAYARFN